MEDKITSVIMYHIIVEAIATNSTLRHWITIAQDEYLVSVDDSMTCERR